MEGAGAVVVAVAVGGEGIVLVVVTLGGGSVRRLRTDSSASLRARRNLAEVPS